MPEIVNETRTIDDLPLLPSAALTDKLVVRRSGQDRAISALALLALFTEGAPSALDSWLEVVAQLEDNTDAVAAFNAAIAARLPLAGGVMTGAIQDLVFAPSLAPTRRGRINTDAVALGQTRELIMPDRNVNLAAFATDLIETKTISGTPANLDFTGFSSAYDSYELVLRGVTPTTNASDLWVRVSTDAGATFLSTSVYNWGRRQLIFGSTTSDLTASSDAKLIAANNVSSDSSLGGVRGKFDIAVAAVGRGAASWSLVSHTGASEYSSIGNGAFANGINAIRLFWGNGSTFQNVNSVSLYGKRR